MAWDDDEPQAADVLAAHEHKVLAEVSPAIIDRMAIINRPVKIVEADLRDQFAAAIIGGWCNDDIVEIWECDEEEDGDRRMKRYAEAAYRMADAMMVARKS